MYKSLLPCRCCAAAASAAAVTGVYQTLADINPNGWHQGCKWNMFYGAAENRELGALLAGQKDHETADLPCRIYLLCLCYIDNNRASLF